MGYQVEFIVHCHAYMNLVEAFGERRVRPEYTLPKKAGMRGGRVDIAILDEARAKPILLIEVKVADAKQYQRRPRKCDHYERLSGCKTICIRGMREANEAVAIVRAALVTLPTDSNLQPTQ